MVDKLDHNEKVCGHMGKMKALLRIFLFNLFLNLFFAFMSIMSTKTKLIFKKSSRSRSCFPYAACVLYIYMTDESLDKSSKKVKVKKISEYLKLKVL